MQITVKTLKDGNYTVTAEATDTILAVKQKLTAEKGIADPSTQKLIFSGRVLSDATVLAEAGVKETDFLVLMIAAAKPAAAAPHQRPRQRLRQRPRQRLRPLRCPRPRRARGEPAGLGGRWRPRSRR